MTLMYNTNIMNTLNIFTDGGSRGNPGPSAYGFVIKQGIATVYEEGKTLGITTNNVAEYTAIIEALKHVRTNRESLGQYSGITVHMDSLLACQQLNNIFRIKKPHLAELFIQVRAEERQVGAPVKYVHIPREKNKEADAMVNMALDKEER
jgi:ribonuclease HI